MEEEVPAFIFDNLTYSNVKCIGLAFNEYNDPVVTTFNTKLSSTRYKIENAFDIINVIFSFSNTSYNILYNFLINV